jgi:hypothetical protein
MDKPEKIVKSQTFTVVEQVPAVGEVWRVSTRGKVETLVTRNSSTAAMDEAVIIYNQALKRLADR